MATKMCVVLDKRTHKGERLPSEEWKELQGPSLLVWNNRNFSDNDLQGIQKLGLGSKRDDFESIGQFGIGFNIVYHITDCPSFITRSNILCVFDPHCKYVPGATKLSPGRRYDEIDKGDFWEKMSGLRSGFLRGSPLPKQPDYFSCTEGSLFRFPLRYTDVQVKKSSIVKVHEKPITALLMERKLKEWVGKIEDAFLFLNHVTQFEYYIIDDKTNSFQLQTRYVATLDTESVAKREQLSHYIGKFKEDKVPYLIDYPLTIHSEVRNASDSGRTWLVQQGVGDIGSESQDWHYIDHVLPKHGIAVPLLYHVSHFAGQAFCFLPLPISTHLPVHINGQFVLSNNRCSLWSGEKDEKERWNRKLFQAITSSYVKFLIKARFHFIDCKGHTKKQELPILEKIASYYHIFPYYIKRKSEDVVPEGDWRDLAESVFKRMWSENAQVLASIVDCRVTWHAFHDNDPFHQAYFQPLAKFKCITPILAKLGMTLTCADHQLYKHLKYVKCSCRIAEPEEVLLFYTQFHNQLLHVSGTCTPCPITNTPFESASNYVKFSQYVTKEDGEYVLEAQRLNDCPLLLTADSYLRSFQQEQQIFCSTYYDLFSQSLAKFLHPDLLSTISSSYFLVENGVTLDVDIINDLLIHNFNTNLNFAQVNNTNEGIISHGTLKKLWECLTEDPAFKQHLNNVITNWALIPATNGYLYSNNSPVVPLVPASTTQDQEIFSLLKSLQVPILDTSVYSKMEQFCPKLSDYDTVLAILHEVHKQVNTLITLPNRNQWIVTLMTYLSRTNFRHYPNVLHTLHSLPLFETATGDFTSLTGKTVYLWPYDFCNAGFSKWVPQDKCVFLKRNGSWNYLCGSNDITCLGGNEFEKEDIYCQLIFPSFPSLSQGDRDQHLEYIRDKMYKQAKLNNSGIFLTNLENLRCLEVDNRLLKISDFCDHKVKLFQVFPEGLNFLSERYRGNEWLAFFRDLGLKTKVTVDEYIDYCQLVSLGKCKDISSASDTLVEYLFSNKAKVWYKDFTTMSVIGNISFVKVSAVPSSSWIRHPCQPPHLISPSGIGLAKINECVISKYAPIVWTVKPIFENDYDFEVILRSLGVILHPTVQDVYQNIINISETNLSNFELFEKYNFKYTKCQHDQKNVSIEQVMIENLQYLYDIDNSQSYFKKLKSVPCIPVSAVDSAFSIPLNYPVLVKPLQVVHVLQLASTSTSSLSLRPYIHPLPHHLTGIYHCLKTIGVNQVVGLDNIQCMLETIHKYYGTQLGPNELKYVRHAVQTMHDLLKECCKNATDKDAAVKLLDPLYLPCRERTQWKLRRSTELVFVDHCRYDDVQSLASLLIAGTDYSLFLLPPDSSHVPVRNRMTEKDVSLMIPKQIRPKSFTINSNEDILDDLRPGTDDCHGVKRFNFFKNIKNQLHDILPKVIVAKLDNCNEDEAKKFIAY